MHHRPSLAWLLAAISACALPACSQRERPAPQTLTVAAAADLKFALDELLLAFHRDHPNITVNVSYGSSGSFYSQLVQRAPFDLFLSADVSYPNRLIDAGLALPDTKFTYAVGRLVIWVPTNSPLDPAKLGLETLRAPSVRRLAIANPEHAPYGKAAVAALQKLGVYNDVKDRLVYGENIAQTAQFIESGAADAGIIALSLAVAPAMRDKGRWWEIPLDAYPRLEQGGVIPSTTRQPDAARALRAFLLSDAGKSVLRRYGFSMPNE